MIGFQIEKLAFRVIWLCVNEFVDLNHKLFICAHWFCIEIRFHQLNLNIHMKWFAWTNCQMWMIYIQMLALIHSNSGNKSNFDFKSECSFIFFPWSNICIGFEESLKYHWIYFHKGRESSKCPKVFWKWHYLCVQHKALDIFHSVFVCVCVSDAVVCMFSFIESGIFLSPPHVMLMPATFIQNIILTRNIQRKRKLSSSYWIFSVPLLSLLLLCVFVFLSSVRV